MGREVPCGEDARQNKRNSLEEKIKGKLDPPTPDLRVSSQCHSAAADNSHLVDHLQIMTKISGRMKH